MRVVWRGLVAACVSALLTTAPAPTYAADDPGRLAALQTVVPGLVISKAPRPEPRTERRRDPLAAAVEKRAQRPQRPAPPTELDVRMVQANIKISLGTGAFAADLRAATSGAPDFVTLNEAVRAPAMLALPNYAFYRGTADKWAVETPVLWRTDRWEALSTGTRYLHRNGSRYGVRAVNWATLRSIGTGKVVTVVSAHASPIGGGLPDLLPVFMKGLSGLVRELSAQGPVFVGGDLNVHYGSRRFPRGYLQSAGLAPTYDVRGAPPGGTGDHGGHTIDYLLFQPGAGVTTTGQWKAELVSDHDAVVGDFHLDW